MALQSGIRPGWGQRMSRTSPAMRQAHFPLSILKATVHRRTRSVPIRKHCVGVTQIQCPGADAICIGRVSYFRQPGVKTWTHGTNENGQGQSQVLESSCVCIRILLMQLSLGT